MGPSVGQTESRGYLVGFPVISRVPLVGQTLPALRFTQEALSAGSGRNLKEQPEDGGAHSWALTCSLLLLPQLLGERGVYEDP